MSTEGWTHSYGGTYKLSSSWSGILGLRGPTLASLDKNDGAVAISNKASATTPSVPGDPSVGIPPFGGAQASLEASWGTSSKAEWASKAQFGESTSSDSSELLHLG